MEFEEIMMDFLLYLFNETIKCVAIVLFFEYFFERKNKNITLIISTVIIIISQTMVSSLNIDLMMNHILITQAFFLIGLINYKQMDIKKFAFIFFFIALTVLIWLVIYQLSLKHIENYQDYYILPIIINCIVLLLAILMIMSFKPIKFKDVNKKYSLYFVVFIMVTIIYSTSSELFLKNINFQLPIIINMMMIVSSFIFAYRSIYEQALKKSMKWKGMNFNLKLKQKKNIILSLKNKIEKSIELGMILKIC